MPFEMPFERPLKDQQFMRMNSDQAANVQHTGCKTYSKAKKKQRISFQEKECLICVGFV